jgi:histidinol dehydrogenase
MFDTEALEATVGQILAEVRQHGDEAVRKYTLKFDKADITTLAVSPEKIQEAAAGLDDDLKKAIASAKSNIEQFHAAQAEEIKKISPMPGVTCWRKSVPIEKVGLYIPGGTAPLFSSILMLAVPACLAGCREIVLCSPPDENGRLHPAILYTAQLTGITQVFRIGGVQAIGALAYGTQSVPRADKLFGPGNQYVTCAKQLVNKTGTAIDLPAGPSEVAVFADESCPPAFVAADLLSQAEHGTDSQVLLVTVSEEVLRQVQEQIALQLETLPRKMIAEAALSKSKAILVRDVPQAVRLVNAYAPEHLILACKDAEGVANQIRHAGSVFLGHYSPESVGDYASGTNHTLPTNGYARAYSGVSLDSFVRKITFQQLTPEGLQRIGPAVETMASAEGLEAHKRAVSIRLQTFQNS